MNFAAYNELRILGFSPDQAVAMADTYKPVGMYELKLARDNGSHTGGKIAAIGLKDEFKQMIKDKERSMQMPFQTAFTLLTRVHKMDKDAAERAADLIEKIVPPHASPDEADPMLGFIEEFATLHAEHPEAAFALLRQAVKQTAE